MGSRVGPHSNSVALPPTPTIRTLTLKLFRRERAISTFDDTFNPPHSSSPSFSTLRSVTPDPSGSGARAFLPGSACRHAARTVSSPDLFDRVPLVQSLRLLTAAFWLPRCLLLVL